MRKRRENHQEILCGKNTEGTDLGTLRGVGWDTDMKGEEHKPEILLGASRDVPYLANT